MADDDDDLPPEVEIVVLDEPPEVLRALLVIQEQVATERLASFLNLDGVPENAGRALQSIVVDTLGEKQELEDIVASWQAIEDGASTTPKPRRPASFVEVVEGLLDMKRSSEKAYLRAAEVAPDEELATRLWRLSRQAGEHAAILQGILEKSVAKR